MSRRKPPSTEQICNDFLTVVKRHLQSLLESDKDLDRSEVMMLKDLSSVLATVGKEQRAVLDGDKPDDETTEELHQRLKRIADQLHIRN